MKPQWVIPNLSILDLYLLQDKEASFVNETKSFFRIFLELLANPYLIYAVILFMLMYVSGCMNTFFMFVLNYWNIQIVSALIGHLAS